MSEKLLTARELSVYLGISEQAVFRLVEKKVLVAYKIGGELLRFRKEQIDAIRHEIDARVTDKDRIDGGAPADNQSSSRGSVSRDPSGAKGGLGSRLSDFLYFNDFYIFSAVLAVLLLSIIFRG